MASSANIASNACHTAGRTGGTRSVRSEEETVFAEGTVLLVSQAALDAVGNGLDERARIADSSLKV